MSYKKILLNRLLVTDLFTYAIDKISNGDPDTINYHSVMKDISSMGLASDEFVTLALEGNARMAIDSFYSKLTIEHIDYIVQSHTHLSPMIVDLLTPSHLELIAEKNSLFVHKKLSNHSYYNTLVSKGYTDK